MQHKCQVSMLTTPSHPLEREPGAPDQQLAHTRRFRHPSTTKALPLAKPYPHAPPTMIPQAEGPTQLAHG